MCILTSASMPTVDQPRHWLEQEYCVDPESGSLLVWSEAPGYYVVYDYTASTEFQGHLLANNISIYEAGSRVMQIHVDSIQDASGVNPESLRPTPQLMAKGPSFGLGSPMRFPILVTEGRGAIPTAIQPVLVHATIDRDGHVLEAEALQNSNPELAAKAIDTLKTRVQGRAIRQREVFVNVEFITGSRQVAAAQ